MIWRCSNNQKIPSERRPDTGDLSTSLHPTHTRSRSSRYTAPCNTYTDLTYIHTFGANTHHCHRRPPPVTICAGSVCAMLFVHGRELILMFNNDVNIGWAAQTEEPHSQPLITVHLPEYQSLITAHLNIPRDRGGVKAGFGGDGPRRSVSQPLSLSLTLFLPLLLWIG